MTFIQKISMQVVQGVYKKFKTEFNYLIKQYSSTFNMSIITVIQSYRLNFSKSNAKSVVKIQWKQAKQAKLW